jgi:hypothetical protein
MEHEDVGQDLEIGELGPVQVKPEGLPSGEQPLDRVAAEVQLAAVVWAEDVAF